MYEQSAKYNEMQGIYTRFVSKTRLNFGQGREFPKFDQGSRGSNQQNRRKTDETIRKQQENQASLPLGTPNINKPLQKIKRFLLLGAQHVCKM